MGQYFVPLLPTHVILDSPSLETWSEYVKKMEIGLGMNQLVKVAYNSFCYSMHYTAFLVSKFPSIFHYILADCGALDNPTNGQVSFNGTLFGSIATYMCNAGFDLIGNAQRMCQASGDWSGDEPVCQSQCKTNMCVGLYYQFFTYSC